MKKANFHDNNQDYKGFIIIENLTELVNYKNDVSYGLQKESAVMASYYNALEESILKGKRIAINPINGVSYFTISEGVKLEYISLE